MLVVLWQAMQMMHQKGILMSNERTVLKIKEWQSPSGKWYAADTDKFSPWWMVPEALGIGPLPDYITLLIEQYHANIVRFIDYGPEDRRNSLLIFNFDNYTDAHRFVLDVNRNARKKKIMIV